MKLKAHNVGTYLVCDTPEEETYLRLYSINDGGIIWYKFIATGWTIASVEMTKTLESSFEECEREAFKTLGVQQS